MGGTILRHLADGDAVHVAICTRGEESRFGKEQVERVQAEARDVHAFLGVTQSHFLDMPAAVLDTPPRRRHQQRPQPGRVDRRPRCHLRPPCRRRAPRSPDHLPGGDGLLPAGGARTTPSASSPTKQSRRPTGTPPQRRRRSSPNVFVDISPFIKKKLEAASRYASQIRPAPDHRSLESLEALSIVRGSSMNLHHAEAFMLIREIR